MVVLVAALAPGTRKTASTSEIIRTRGRIKLAANPSVSLRELQSRVPEGHRFEHPFRLAQASEPAADLHPGGARHRALAAAGLREAQPVRERLLGLHPHPEGALLVRHRNVEGLEEVRPRKPALDRHLLARPACGAAGGNPDLAEHLHGLAELDPGRRHAEADGPPGEVADLPAAARVRPTTGS